MNAKTPEFSYIYVHDLLDELRRNPGNKRLQGQVHALITAMERDVYHPNFTPDERECPWKKWVTPNLQGSNIHNTIVLAVEPQFTNAPGSDPHPDDYKVLGMAVGNYDKVSHQGFYAYLARDPQAPGGLGAELFAHRQRAMDALAGQQQKQIPLSFLECEHPLKRPVDGKMNRLKRLDTFRKWGAQIVDINLSLPSLEKDGSLSFQKDYVLLAYVNEQALGVSKGDPRFAIRLQQCVISRMYQAYLRKGITEPEHHPEFVQMVRSMTSRGLSSDIQLLSKVYPAALEDAHHTRLPDAALAKQAPMLAERRLTALGR